MAEEVKFVFVSIASCGHAQTVYADVLQSDGSRWEQQIAEDLDGGLTVKRITLEEFRANYSENMCCNCAEVTA